MPRSTSSAASGGTSTWRPTIVFHGTIYDGSHNAFLAETTRNVRLRLAPFRRVQFDGQDRLARSFVEHGRVVAAIERGDAAEAEAQMRAHIGVVRDAVDAVIGRPSATAADPRGARVLTRASARGMVRTSLDCMQSACQVARAATPARGCATRRPWASGRVRRSGTARALHTNGTQDTGASS